MFMLSYNFASFNIQKSKLKIFVLKVKRDFTYSKLQKRPKLPQISDFVS